MAKYKATKKVVRDNYRTILSLLYCSAQNLLYFESPEAYTTRREGWGADVYGFGNIAIVTGYAPFGNDVDYDIVKEYDSKAELVLHSISDYD